MTPEQVVDGITRLAANMDGSVRWKRRTARSRVKTAPGRLPSGHRTWALFLDEADRHRIHHGTRPLPDDSPHVISARGLMFMRALARQWTPVLSSVCKRRGL